MIKKILSAMMALTMLFVASCQNELDTVVTGGETSVVTFNIQAPELNTRAYSDGTTDKVLYYAVYDAYFSNADGSTNLKYLGELSSSTTINKSTSLQLELVTGNKYMVVFWAATSNAPYTFTAGDNTATVTVDYNNVNCNDENLDAFFGVTTPFTINGNQTVGVTLRRPFAQLNIGTNDYALAAKSDIKPTLSTVTVKSLKNTLSLINGTVSGDEAVVTFNYGNIPSYTEGEATYEKFPVNDYDYLAMNYLLVGADQELVDVEFACKDEQDRTFSRTVGSVPVKRNYRTNIYGKILTSSAALDVEINPDYDEPDSNIYNVTVDGVSYDDFATAVAKAIELKKPVEFIQNVTIDADNTITVAAGEELTLNLNGYTLSGVSDQTGSNRNIFDVRGTMTVNGANNMTRAAAAGNGVISIKHVGNNMGWNNSTNVFNITAGGVLNIKNANAINFGGSDMGFVAHLNNWGEVTLNVENSTLESNYVAVRVFNSGNDMNNVTIKNSTLKGGSYAFWVHNYTAADFGSQDKVDAHKALLNFDILNGTNKFEGKNDTPIRYGMTNAVYLDQFGYKPVDSSNDLQTALEAGESFVKLNNGEYELSNSLGNSQTEISITGNGIENTTVKGASSSNINHPGVYAHGKHLVFENLTYVTPNNGYQGGFGHAASVTFINCKIIGQYYAHSEAPHTFTNCVIDPLTGYLYTYASDCVFEGCTFESSEGKALQVYEDASTGENTVSIKNCTFVAAKQATTWDGKPVTAIDINSNGAIFNVTVEDCTAIGYGVGLNSESDMWNIKNNAQNVNLTIDGELKSIEGFGIVKGYYAQGNTYTVLNGEGFKAVATTVLSDGTKNVTVELANDIDLAGIEWPAVKTNAAFVLDGKGYSIKNLTTSAVEEHGFYSTAMFTSTRKAATIKNLVVENATVTGKGGDNSHGAVLVACNYAALSISDVTVKGSTISNCDRTGGLVTYLYFTTATVENCVVENCTINSIGTAGAILGINNSHNFTMKGCTVTNTTVSSSEGSNKAGILIGTWQNAGTLTKENNSFTGSKAINAGTETNNEIGRNS